MTTPLRWALVVVLGACATGEEAVETLPSCAESMEAGAAPTSLDEVAALLEVVKAERVPELADVRITLGELSSDDSFFVANLDLATVSEPPRERAYVVNANPRMFEAPSVPYSAAYGILVHELKHIVDYTGMESSELLEFGVWYATADVAAYERETDEFALERGCAQGIKDYREWLYARISPEAADGKRRDYYTPDEIDQWVAAQGD